MGVRLFVHGGAANGLLGADAAGGGGEREGIVVVYVDLWSDQHRDPGELIAEAIGRVLAGETGRKLLTHQRIGGWVL